MNAVRVAVEPHTHERACPAVAAGQPADVLGVGDDEPAVAEGVMAEQVSSPVVRASLHPRAEAETPETVVRASVVHRVQKSLLGCGRGARLSWPGECDEAAERTHQQQDDGLTCWATGGHRGKSDSKVSRYLS